MNASAQVLVYGATGHRGRFVVDELLRCGLPPVLAGRSAERLASFGRGYVALERRALGLDDPEALRQAVAGVGAVVNCAGPFLDTVSGRDIYAVTAPIVVEGVVRLLDGRHRGAGALAPGEAFDARDVLAVLERDVDGFVVG